MKKKILQRPPNHEPWVWMPQKLLTSRAWCALGINGRRFIDFLMIENMRHAGQENGRLLAPRRQLEDFGIGEHFVSGAIEQAERLGLVDCRRCVGRRPSLYALTWLHLYDGSEPSNRFLRCDDAAAAISAVRKVSKRRKSYKKRAVATVKPQSVRMTAVCAEDVLPNSSHKACSDCHTAVTTRGAKQQHLSRSSYQGGDNSLLQSSGNMLASATVGPRHASAAKQPNPGEPNGRVVG